MCPIGLFNYKKITCVDQLIFNECNLQYPTQTPGTFVHRNLFWWPSRDRFSTLVCHASSSSGARYSTPSCKVVVVYQRTNIVSTGEIKAVLMSKANVLETHGRYFISFVQLLPHPCHTLWQIHIT